MTEQYGEDNTLTPDVALEDIDRDRFPKLYAATEKTLKAKEVVENYKKRAEQAEERAKKKFAKNSTGKIAPQQSGYSLKDIRALADIHDDDVDEVVEYAERKGISVAEAKRAPLMQSFLRDSNENRKTADASNTGKTKRGATKTSGASLLKRFEETGEVPETKEELDRMLNHRFPTPKKLGT